MKSIINKKLYTVATMCMILFVLLFPISNIANAGVSDIIICEDNSFNSSISSSEWYYSNVSAVNSELYFSPSVTENARIISKNRIQNLKTSGYNDCFNLDVDLRLISLVGKFGIAFGLETYSSRVGSKNSSMLFFTATASNVYLHISNYDSNSAESIVLSEYSLADKVNLGVNFNIKFYVDVDGGINVKINNGLVYSNEESNCATTGYLGFGQINVNEAFITHADVRAFKNDTPQNPRYLETFDNSMMNHNVWYTQSKIGYYSDSYVKSVNGVLVFKNVADSYISSKFRYSNFILDFDLTSLQREAVYDSDKNLITPISSAFNIVIGAINYKSLNASYDYLFEFSSNSNSGLKKGSATLLTIKKSNIVLATIELPHEYNIWNNAVVKDRAVNFRMTVNNGNVLLQMKYNDEGGYTAVLNYKLDFTPLGYVQLRGTGFSYLEGKNSLQRYVKQGNFSIDNLMIDNTDTDGQVIEVTYAYYGWIIPGDYDYIDNWNDSDLLHNN